MAEYYAEREKRLRTDWFKDHQARLENYTANIDLDATKEHVTYHIFRILWAKLGTSNYRCHFVIHNNALMVHGDIGEAVYCWGQNINPAFLAGLDLGYFASKCCASESGRRFMDWDTRVAKDALMERFKQDTAMRKRFLETEGGMASIHQRDEWHQWLHENGYDVFGDGWYEWAPEIGDVIAWRCQGHLVGLKMAVEQLKAKVA